MSLLRRRLARARSGILLAIAATPAILAPTAFAAEWLDPSSALALPPVQNALCKYSGAVCTRQNQIRLDTVDYREDFDSMSPAGGADGWQSFIDLDPRYNTGPCIDYQRIGYITTQHGTYDGNLLRFSGDSLAGKFSQQWDFLPITGWVSAETANAGSTATLVAGRQFIFDYLGSTRNPMPRDAAITIRLQVVQGGTPRPDLENTYVITFPRGDDQFSYSCILPMFASGDYQLTFLLSDDFFGEDKPISIELNVTGR